MSFKVCVTGASGYIASHAVQQLLQAGHTVIATVRDSSNEKKVGHLKRIAEELNAQDRLIFKNADLLKPGSFDEAIEGCDYVFHMASPFQISGGGDGQERFITPAVEGTKNVLGAVGKASTVKRVVLTSSCAAIYGTASDKDAPFTEEDWNRSSTLSSDPYSLSKRMAEEAAWEIAKAQDKYDLVTINPALVVGPTLSGRDDSASAQLIRRIACEMSTGVPNWMMGLVDVRDVARAHVVAMTHENAKGRYIVAPESKTFLEIAQILKAKFPNLNTPSRTVPKFLLYMVGPFLGISWYFIRNNVNKELHFDNTKVKTELGFEFTPISESVCDMVQSMIDHRMIQYEQ